MDLRSGRQTNEAWLSEANGQESREPREPRRVRSTRLSSRILVLVGRRAPTMSTPFQDQSQNAPYYTATPTPSAPSPHPQSTPDFTQPGPSTTQPSRPATGQAAEEMRKDKTLAEFLLMLDDYEPLVRTRTSSDGGRNAENAFALRTCALTCGAADTQRSYGVLSPASRLRMRRCQTVSTAIPFAAQPCSSEHHKWLRTRHSKRLLSLAAQKFVSDIAADAYQHARIRANAAGGRSRANQPSGTASARVSANLVLC